MLLTSCLEIDGLALVPKAKVMLLRPLNVTNGILHRGVMTTNLALGFIKPHAAKSASVWAWIRTALEQRGIRVFAETIVTGPEIREKGLIDRHYTVIARVGGCRCPQTLELNDPARSAFQHAFGLSWHQALEQNLLFSGLAALEKLNVTPAALMERWATVKTAKVGPGFYVAAMQGLYILNGFYPSIREIYTADDGIIRSFLLEFDGAMLPWKQFRAEVIGATDPVKALTTSLRGTLFHRREEFGLAMDARDNVIHASASPFEAMMERAIWMPGFELAADPLWQALTGSGIGQPALAALAGHNPVVTLDGQTASAIDHLEDTDTPQAAALIRRLIGGVHGGPGLSIFP